jgi:orotate phosphoribosyltransferase
MIISEDIARKTATHLLQIEAIKLQPNNPFIWASGWKSPIYCDNRIVLSHPEIRAYISQNMAQFLKTTYGKPDVIAGVATGAIGIGILVAEVLGLPFIYVRPEPKSHGRQNQIEGKLTAGQKVVVIEDLISTGKSSLNAVNALKEAQADVLGMIAIFTYGFKAAQDSFAQNKITLNTLSNYNYLIKEAKETHYISAEEEQFLSQWNANPSGWMNQ